MIPIISIIFVVKIAEMAYLLFLYGERCELRQRRAEPHLGLRNISQTRLSACIWRVPVAIANIMFTETLLCVLLLTFHSLANVCNVCVSLCDIFRCDR